MDEKKSKVKVIMMDPLSAAKASGLLTKAGVIVPKNKVIVAVFSGEQKIGSFVIPQNVEATDLKKGVVILVGDMEENPLGKTPKNEAIEAGDIITFGDYAGKQVYTEEDILMLDNYRIHVLSVHEIVMVEKRQD